MTTVTRRTGGIFAALAVALAVVVPAPAHADDDFVAGAGSAAASAVQEGPKAGGLALTILFGESLSGYVGTAAQAASQTIDMGLLGTLLSAKQCDESPGPLKPEQVPTATRVDSREPDAEKGRSRTYGGTQAGSPLQVQVGHEQASAATDPRGTATTTMALATLPGVLDMRGGTAQTETGIVKNATRLSRASVDLGNLDLFGGLVRLSHLRWNAVQQTGKGAKAAGTFSIGSAELGGRPLPTNAPAQTLTAINQVTSQVGVTLEPPAVTQENGVVQVSPLVVHLQSSPLEQKVTSPALVAAQPARQAVTAALTKLSCRFQTLITVADVSAGPTTGSGSFELGFGGAAATTDGTRFDNPFGDLGGGPTGVLGAGLSAPSPGSAASGLVAGRALGTATSNSAGGPSSRTVRRGQSAGGILAGARSLPGRTGGWAILVGFLAVAGVLGVAGADWWRLRRSEQ